MIISHVKLIAFQLSLFCKNYRFSKTFYLVFPRIHVLFSICKPLASNTIQHLYVFCPLFNHSVSYKIVLFQEEVKEEEENILRSVVERNVDIRFIFEYPSNALSECNDLYFIAIALIAFTLHEIKQCPVFFATPGI